MAKMTAAKPTSVVLTRAHRDAVFDEIESVFESAGDLPFMLEHAPESTVDCEDARDLISQLQAAVGLLDQIGWQRRGDEDRYVVEVDEGVNRFAARIERFALAALDYNRQGVSGSRNGLSASVRRLIDTDLEKLQAARILRTALMIARGPGGQRRQSLDDS